MRLAGGQRGGQGIGVHVRDHQHGTAGSVDRHGSEQVIGAPPGLEFEGFIHSMAHM